MCTILFLYSMLCSNIIIHAHFVVSWELFSRKNLMAYRKWNHFTVWLEYIGAELKNNLYIIISSLKTGRHKQIFLRDLEEHDKIYSTTTSRLLRFFFTTSQKIDSCLPLIQASFSVLAQDNTIMSNNSLWGSEEARDHLFSAAPRGPVAATRPTSSCLSSCCSATRGTTCCCMETGFVLDLLKLHCAYGRHDLLTCGLIITVHYNRLINYLTATGLLSLIISDNTI